MGQWALEESRKEAAREERKRRREKRDEEEVQRDEETTSTKTPKEADAAARAQSEVLQHHPLVFDTQHLCQLKDSFSLQEPITCVGGSTDFSQSTPPLSGVPHSSLSTPTRRTPVLRVTRLPHTPVRGVGSHDRDVTPVLGDKGEGWDKGEGGDGEVKDSAVLPENKLDETVGPREKRHSLALSLKRGKRRVCEEISTSSTTITNITLTTSTSSEEPPSSKRQRVGLEGSTGRATVSTPQTPPETQEVSLPQSTTQEPTAAKSTTQEPTAAKSTTLEPTAAKSTTLEPTAAKSTTLEPTAARSTTLEPTAAKSTTLEPTAARSTTLEPTAAKTTTLGPTAAKTTTLGPTAAKTTTLEPTAAKGITLEPTAAKGTTWEQKLRRRPSKSMLPDLFAPVGVAPAAYSATILRVFNSYISQLREAQNRVLSRVAWGNPVPAHHRQPLSTLTWHPSQSRQSLVRPGGSPSWPSIDLQTGEIVGGSLSGRRVGSKRRRPRASFAEEDDGSFVSTPDKRQSGTPVKQRQVQKHRDTGEDGSGERWSDLPPVTTGTTHTLSVPAHSTTPDSPPDKLRPLPVNSDLSEETAPRASQSMLATPPVGVASSFLLSGQGRQCELGEGELGEGEIGEGELGEGGIGEGELGEGELGEGGIGDGEIGEGGIGDGEIGEGELGDGEIGDGEIGEGGIGEGGIGDGENSETGEQGTRGERGRAGGVASSEEPGDDIRPRKRRRAVILEDSDSETELDSISSSSNDVTVTKNSTEPTGKSNSLFKRALAVLGGGRKRQSVKQLPVKGGKPLSGSRGSVVDLTAGRGEGQKMSYPREKGELVPCPLCSELFPLSLIEAHAAVCQEEGPGESSCRPPPPLRQSSLLTPRFNRWGGGGGGGGGGWCCL